MHGRTTRLLFVSLLLIVVAAWAWLVHDLRQRERGGPDANFTRQEWAPLPADRGLVPPPAPDILIDGSRLPANQTGNKPHLPALSDDPVKQDRQLVEAAGLASDDGAALLEVFRQRTLSPEEKTRVADLIERFGEMTYLARQKAAASVVALGPKTMPLLRGAAGHRDPEVRQRVGNCVRLLADKELDPAVLAAAVRIIFRLRPEGSAAALLGYLPFADRPAVVEEVRAALAEVAVRDGEPERAVLEALQSPEPMRRAAAAEALCRANVRDQFGAVRKLLADPIPTVRLYAALGLTQVRDKDAVPILIALLDQLPVNQAWHAETMLCRLADGRGAPAVPLGKDPAEQAKCRAAWGEWWKGNAATTDLALLDEKPKTRNTTLAILLDLGRLLEVDADGQLLWKIDDLRFPLDAQLLPGDRVLVAESQGSCVTERSFKGDILWEKTIERPLMAQRLANGNVFIATMSLMVEVDRTGTEVFSYQTDGMINKAVKLPGGDYAAVTNNRKYIRVNAAGQEVHSFPAEMHHFGGRLEVLPNGRVLLPLWRSNKVIEVDGEGKTVWQVTTLHPVAAVRLPNGNTLVTTMDQLRAVELDRDGKEVSEFRAESRVTRAWRR